MVAFWPLTWVLAACTRKQTEHTTNAEIVLVLIGLGLLVTSIIGFGGSLFFEPSDRLYTIGLAALEWYAIYCTVLFLCALDRDSTNRRAP